MRYRLGPGDYVTGGIFYTLLIAYSFSTLYPFYNILVMSLSDGSALTRGIVYMWPRDFSLENYKAVFTQPDLVNAFMMSVLRTLAGAALTVGNMCLVAYALRRKDLSFRKGYLVLLTIPVFFGGGLIPTFLNFRLLHLYDTFWIYILPSLFSYFYFLILIAFFNDMGESLEEAAKIDGAGYFMILSRIYMPLSLPVLAAITLFEGVNQWNAFFDTLYFTSSKDLVTLQALLAKIITSTETMATMQFAGEEHRKLNPKGVQLATMMVATLPIVFIYPFLQKYFVKGIMLGAVKE